MSRTGLDNDNSDTLLLPDGRKLGYAQYGSLTGRAVLFAHGHPGSRLEGAHLHDLGLKLGARIIAPDRPGMGWSSPHPDRTLLDYPKDLEHLADHLKLERYGVLVRVAWYFRASS
jgi:pimeloyl-ACP methyl ester carboxylesterase